MNQSELMAKARRAVLSAKVLLDVGDADGACNRAYYAMFDAARAAPTCARVTPLSADRSMKARALNIRVT